MCKTKPGSLDVQNDGQLMSCDPPVLWLSTHAVLLAAPIGDDGQMMSCGPPVLWLSTHAAPLTAPIGDNGQLMSCGPPVLWLSAHAVQLTAPNRRRQPADVLWPARSQLVPLSGLSQAISAKCFASAVILRTARHIRGGWVSRSNK